MTATAFPPIQLDVRPILARGEEPFDVIMEHAARVPEGGILELVAPFEPLPLYGVLSARGFAHETAELRPGEWRVRFTQTGIVGARTVRAVYERHPGTARVFAEHGVDLCCGGEKTLEVVAAAHGLALAALLAELQQAALTR
jgi:uncharacterized protein (DUF2249 family)